jgi:hypothetical protein
MSVGLAACAVDNPFFELAPPSATTTTATTSSASTSTTERPDDSSGPAPTSEAAATTDPIDDSTTTTTTGPDLTTGSSGAESTAAGDCVPGEVEACYSGDPEQIDVGECKAGERVCEADGEWGACAGEVLPAPEQCVPGEDHDCDGVPNNAGCLPASCAAVKALDPAALDGEYTLYLDGDAGRPWTAWCHDMGGAPREYLSLPKLENIGRFVAIDLKTRQTRYLRVRLDPATLVVDIGDATFTMNTGTAEHNREPVQWVAYGAAMTCNQLATSAKIDLRDTPFGVADDSFCVGGFMAKEGEVVEVGPQQYTIVGGGKCGWRAPSPPCAFDPVNGSGGGALHLDYLGP